MVLYILNKLDDAKDEIKILKYEIETIKEQLQIEERYVNEIYQKYLDYVSFSKSELEKLRQNCLT